MIKKINASGNQSLEIKDSLIKFSEMIDFGDFIAQTSGNFVLNSFGEIFQLKPVKNQSNLGHRLRPSKIKTTF